MYTRMILIFIIGLSCMMACSSSDRSLQPDLNGLNGSKKTSLKLIDSLGEIKFTIPEVFDTTYSWVYESDCGKPCEFQLYRYQPKKYPVFKESGLKKPIIKSDSVNSFTIKHSMYFPFHNGDTTSKPNRQEFLKYQLPLEYNMKLIKDTVEKIGDRYYAIFYMESMSSTEYRNVVYSVSSIKSNDIIFIFEFASKSQRLEKWNEVYTNILRSIRIEKGI